ncbi:pentatricopeptide repeat-containing protein At3g14580, mitochondrial [Elaeis guineensis]|uniref:Pentatricopeptide repeat-containing protein At3g14580, mitochondrial n=1 Tax=Elaeis guineensis var. tenera TaxID=51953 RepID=A0A6I9SE55_ELAGV|nr:pentatricopeptide repeat-containing protein At3g14580, mitochondrial [Elaeis guineensis]XP_010941591.1 pentatricopeptide repeat-containing protein At3g14580, mitochondrial [Elaeis guineensis]
MAVYRKLTSRAIFNFIHVDVGIIRISKYSIASLSRFGYAWDNDDFWLRRLDHKDWLAPNEILKIFKNVRDPELIIGAFEKASSRMDYKPSEALYTLIIEKLACARKFGVIEDLLERSRLEKCRLSDEFFYKLIKLYGNVANHPEQAIKTLLRMPDFHCWPTTKTFNYVLNMLVCARQFDIIHEVYLSAPRLGVCLDTCCFNILIKGLCQCGKLDAAFSLLHEIPKQGCRPNATTYSTLMHALCKDDKPSEAFELCERMEKEGCHPDTITFNILISGLCKQGQVAKGMELLKTMKLKGCYPNSGTNQALLYGLLNTNKFVEAKHFMDMMISEGRRPSFLSYKLTIDGLCSKNLLNDAVMVLKKMVQQGFVPRVGTWKRILECMF